ncbi:hypothetical protein PoB_003681100 [Plakobranchus ocellatus]|uniref:Uncharacterized protein n=1 Tax=Plakobranchus ocellatus TaxID=259542 RepID=A0AAV4AUS7_9GAST|nr:hypothetical protein PoB_003681100 [Plakobranchus ocellatus]
MASKPDPLTSASGGPKIPGGTSLSCLFTWLGTRGDYSSIDKKDKSLTGWRRYFSTVTKEGRVNIVVGTYLAASVAGYVMWRNYTSKRDRKHETSQ